MQLSKKTETNFLLFVTFSVSTLNFGHFDQRMSLMSQVYLKLLVLKNGLT